MLSCIAAARAAARRPLAPPPRARPAVARAEAPAGTGGGAGRAGGASLGDHHPKRTPQRSPRRSAARRASLGWRGGGRPATAHSACQRHWDAAPRLTRRPLRCSTRGRGEGRRCFSAERAPTPMVLPPWRRRPSPVQNRCQCRPQGPRHARALRPLLQLYTATHPTLLMTHLCVLASTLARAGLLLGCASFSSFLSFARAWNEYWPSCGLRRFFSSSWGLCGGVALRPTGRGGFPAPASRGSWRAGARRWPEQVGSAEPAGPQVAGRARPLALAPTPTPAPPFAAQNRAAWAAQGLPSLPAASDHKTLQKERFQRPNLWLHVLGSTPPFLADSLPAAVEACLSDCTLADVARAQALLPPSIRKPRRQTNRGETPAGRAQRQRCRRRRPAAAGRAQWLPLWPRWGGAVCVGALRSGRAGRGRDTCHPRWCARCSFGEALLGVLLPWRELLLSVVLLSALTRCVVPCFRALNEWVCADASACPRSPGVDVYSAALLTPRRHGVFSFLLLFPFVRGTASTVGLVAPACHVSSTLQRWAARAAQRPPRAYIKTPSHGRILHLASTGGHSAASHNRPHGNGRIKATPEAPRRCVPPSLRQDVGKRHRP